ncbi:MAG: hypothetical protein H6935_03190 [Thiobacillus sp.]|nr:hypothetical protein [Thiobacillus sp.]
MEIQAINTISQTTTPLTGSRTATEPPRQSGEVFSQRLAAQVQPETEAQKQANSSRKPEDNASNQSRPEDEPASLGRIRFEMDDGTRVAKFFDTKDVLIYQVPPEGSIYLVRLREQAAQDQVETSA